MSLGLAVMEGRRGRKLTPDNHCLEHCRGTVRVPALPWDKEPIRILALHCETLEMLRFTCYSTSWYHIKHIAFLFALKIRLLSKIPFKKMFPYTRRKWIKLLETFDPVQTLPFTNKDQVQRNKVTCPRPHCWWDAEAGPELRPPDASSSTLTRSHPPLTPFKQQHMKEVKSATWKSSTVSKTLARFNLAKS